MAGLNALTSATGNQPDSDDFRSFNVLIGWWLIEILAEVLGSATTSWRSLDESHNEDIEGEKRRRLSMPANNWDLSCDEVLTRIRCNTIDKQAKIRAMVDNQFIEAKYPSLYRSSTLDEPSVKTPSVEPPCLPVTSFTHDLHGHVSAYFTQGSGRLPC